MILRPIPESSAFEGFAGTLRFVAEAWVLNLASWSICKKAIFLFALSHHWNNLQICIA